MTIRELRQRHMRERGEMLERQLSEIEDLRAHHADLRVPVAPLAEAVSAIVERSKAAGSGRRQAFVEERDCVSWSSLAGAVWGPRKTQPGKGDSTRLKRALGLMPHATSRACATTIDYDVACDIAAAVGVDPLDVGL
jgi:hypothetical protein